MSGFRISDNGLCSEKTIMFRELLPVPILEQNGGETSTKFDLTGTASLNQWMKIDPFAEEPCCFRSASPQSMSDASNLTAVLINCCLSYQKRPYITTAVMLLQYLLSNYVLHALAYRNHHRAPALKIKQRKLLIKYY